MEHQQFSALLFQLRVWAFQICETLLFISFVICLTILTIRQIIHFVRGVK